MRHAYLQNAVSVCLNIFMQSEVNVNKVFDPVGDSVIEIQNWYNGIKKNG